MVVVALILLFTGPWLVYLVVPVPDQLAEYRNYSMVAGFALLVSLLPWVFWAPLMAYFIGMSHVHSLSWTDQITFWKKAQQTASGDKSRATGEIGAFLKIAGKNNESEAYLLDALKLNPVFAPAMDNLVGIYLMANREAEAYAMSELLIEKCPNYAAGWQMMGILYEQKGRMVDAVKCFERAVSLVKDFPQSCNHLGLIAFREQRWLDALEWFRRAGKYHKGEPTFQYNEAMTLYALGRKDEADAIRKRFDGIPIQWNPEMVPQPQQPKQELVHA